MTGRNGAVRGNVAHDIGRAAVRDDLDVPYLRNLVRHIELIGPPIADGGAPGILQVNSTDETASPIVRDSRGPSQRRIVVIGDRRGGDALTQNAVGGVAEYEGEGLVTLVEVVAIDCRRNRLRLFARQEGQASRNRLEVTACDGLAVGDRLIVQRDRFGRSRRPACCSRYRVCHQR